MRSIAHPMGLGRVRARANTNPSGKPRVAWRAGSRLSRGLAIASIRVHPRLPRATRRSAPGALFHVLVSLAFGGHGGDEIGEFPHFLFLQEVAPGSHARIANAVSDRRVGLRGIDVGSFLEELRRTG